MTFPLLIVGLILRLTSGWFSGQHTVGDILLWVGVAGLVIHGVIFICAAWAAWMVNRRRFR